MNHIANLALAAWLIFCFGLLRHSLRKWKQTYRDRR